MEYYVILENGIEYNDSTYDIAGGATIRENAFSSKAEALEKAKELLKKTISGFHLTDFDEGYGRFSYVRPGTVATEFLEEKELGKRVYNSGYRSDEYFEDTWHLLWEEFIEWCEERGHDWTEYAPNLYEVKRVVVT